MSNDVWALAELSNGKLASISLQLASKAAELAGAFGGESVALAFGVNTAAAAQELLNARQVGRGRQSKNLVAASYRKLQAGRSGSRRTVLLLSRPVWVACTLGLEFQ